MDWEKKTHGMMSFLLQIVIKFFLVANKCDWSSTVSIKCETRQGMVICGATTPSKWKSIL